MRSDRDLATSLVVSNNIDMKSESLKEGCNVHEDVCLDELSAPSLVTPPSNVIRAFHMMRKIAFNRVSYISVSNDDH